MMFDFLGVLVKHWKAALIVTALSAVLLAVTILIHQRNSARAKLAEIQRVATEAQAQTESNLETIRSAVPLMVETAQRNAVANYIARYGVPGNRSVACPVANGLRLPGSGGQVASTTIAYEPAGEPVPTEFIEACARDAGRLQLWQELCRLNTKLCEVVK